MKRDYYSDIKLAQRIIFQNTAYLLTMLDKKVDSFTSLKTPNMRARNRSDLLHPDNVLQPQAPKFFPNPLRPLADDLSKPVWNCTTRVEPVAISLLPQTPSHDLQKITNAFNYSMNRFLERFKIEHEDEVSLKLHINFVDRLGQINSFLTQFSQQKVTKTQQLLQELFLMLIRANQKKKKQSDLQNTLQCEKIELAAELQILEKLTLKNSDTSTYAHSSLVAEVCNFSQIVQGYIKNVAQSYSGPVYINYALQAETLPLVLHPMMMSIFCFIKNQIAAQEQGKEQNQPKSSIAEVPVNAQPPIFQELKTHNCSKITFINLDGYETNLNLMLAKHLGKYLQYISFPEEQSYLIQNDLNLKSYFRGRSQMLAKHYLAQYATKQGRSSLFRGGQLTQAEALEELYKKLIVIPVKSIYLAQKKKKNQGIALSVDGYESHFVSFIMKEIIFNQVRQFGPSVIIVSHANTLSILPQHLQQILSQLSILTNMKIIFYNNITHSLLPHTFISEPKDLFSSYHKQYIRRKQQWSISLSPSIKGENFPLTLDMLERASIFLKVCSGTTNLGFQAREADQKYENSRLVGYAANIMKQVCRKHPSLYRYANRFIHYLKVQKLLSDYYQPKPISAYHRNALKSVEAALQQCYGQTVVTTQQWISFSIQYAINLNKQKESQESKYFTKLNSGEAMTQTGIDYGLIALEFQILQNQTRKLITLSNNSQVIISKSKKYPVCPIFVLNHLANIKSQSLSSYYGFVDQVVETSCEARVALQELQFYQNVYELGPFQHFTEFNYHQTQTSVILFWPLLYDTREAIAHAFSRTSYHPPITSLLFVGLKSNLKVLSLMQPANESYRYLHPRIGCTCYQPLHSNTIYVFGGFYTDTANYLDFQTDISVITLGNEGMIFENIPKAFFMNHQYQNDLSFSVVTSINNDFVRPRVEYEVYQLQSCQTAKQILLLGGVGQKFTRPFSLIGYMAHLIRFQSGVLTKINRIKLNNIVPANLSRPLKQRVTAQIPVIKVAQNKRIYATNANIHPGVLTFTDYKLKYISEDPNLDKKYLGKNISGNRRMTYNKTYEVGLDERWEEIQLQKENFNIVAIRESNESRVVKWALRHFSFNQKSEAVVNLVLDSKRIYDLALKFNLEDDAAQKFVNLQGNVVNLAPQHVIAADTFSTQIFVLFSHPQFTQGRSVLARSSIRNINETIENEILQVNLSQIYCFDSTPSKHVIKIVEAEQVALLHGFQFSQETTPEYLIRRVGSYFTRIGIQGSGFIKQISQAVLISNTIFKPNKKSFIFGSGPKVMCLSFLTVARMQTTNQRMVVIIQELQLNEQNLQWRMKSCYDVIFQVHFPAQTQVFQKQPWLVPKEVLDVYQILESKDIFIVLGCEDYVFQTSLNIQNMAKTSLLHFQPIKVENPDNELEMRFMLVKDYQNERKRDRQSGYHIYAKSINKGESPAKSETQIISEETGTAHFP